MLDTLTTSLLATGGGAMVGLAALGLVIVYRSTGVLNLAHAAMAAVGGYAYVSLCDEGVPALAAVVLAAVIVGILGVLIQLLVMAPLKDATTLTKLTASVGVLLVLQSLLLYSYGNTFRPAPRLLPTTGVHLPGGVTIGSDRLILLGIAVGAAAILWALYRFTVFGITASALAESRFKAQIYGLRTSRMALWNWFLGGLLAGAAGALLAPITGLSVVQSGSLIVPVLAAAIVGSLTSFPLVLLGGIVIAILQAVVTSLTVRQGVAEVVPLAVILIFVLARGSSIPDRSAVGLRLPALGTGRVRWPVLTAVLALFVISVYSWLPSHLYRPMVVTLTMAIILLSLVVLTGYAGQVSLAQFGLAGVGAYTAAQLSANYDLPFPVLFVSGVLVGAVLGGLVALPSLRVRSLSLAVVTLGVSVLLFSLVFNSLQSIIVSSPEIFGLDLSLILHPQRYVVAAGVLLAVCSLGVANLRRSRAGLKMVAIRGNERAAAALGINVPLTKMAAFSLAGGIAAAGGIMFAFQTPVIGFEIFEPFKSAHLLAWATIGGTGFIVGPIVGATLAPGSLGTSLSHLLFNDAAVLGAVGGALLIVTLLAHPDGVAGLPHQLGKHSTRRKPSPTRTKSKAAALPVQEAPAAPARTAEGPLLSVRDVSVSFSGVNALKDVSLEVRPGQVHGLIGSNGAGKTTLLDVISGFVRPQTGSVRLGDDDVSHFPVHRRAKRGLGRSFQNVQLFPDLSVLDNLRTADCGGWGGSVLRGLVAPGKPQVTRSAASAVNTLGLGDVLDLGVEELTHGHRQLVSIARALAADPSVVMLDEPAAGLDEVERRELVDLLRRLAEERELAVLLVEHDVDLVMRACDWVTVLHEGQVLASGPPQEIREHAGVMEAYLGHGDPAALEELEDEVH